MTAGIELNKLSDYYSELPANTPAHVVVIGDLMLYFSYNTIIAFRSGGSLTIRQNDWSTTTGRHLNAINPDKSIRVDKAIFEKALEAVIRTFITLDY